LPGNPRADKKAEHGQSDKKQKINDADRSDAAADELLQSPHRGINQIGKENGEKKQNQRSSRGVQKADAHGKKECREQNARGA